MRGKYVNNETSVVLANNTAKSQTFTVPAEHRWHILGGRVHNNDDVARNVQVNVTTSGGTALAILFNTDAVLAAGIEYFPRTSSSDESNPFGFPPVVDAGEKVVFYWFAGGASTGGTCSIYLRVLEEIIK